MSTPINGWVGSWLCVAKAQPQGNWIIIGDEAFRVGGAPDVMSFPANGNITNGNHPESV